MKTRPLTARPITASPITARAVSAGQLSPMAAAILPLFANGTPGTWFDPSDFSTMFQDAAGTTPVTALGQPVGKILDKSPLGKHATCPGATTSRPTIEARVNLATNTGFSLGGVGSVPTGWIGRGLVTGRVVASDSASGYAMRVTGGGVSAGTGATDDVRLGVSGWVTAGVSTTVKFKIRKAPESGAGQAAFVWASGPTQFVSLTDNWTEVSYTRNAPGTSNSLFFGSSVAGVVYDITDFSVVVSTDTSFPYQRVNTATNYTDIGAPRYLAFDGADDWLETAAIDMTGTDSVVAVAGVRKNSDDSQAVICEFSASLASNNGVFVVFAPTSPGTASTSMSSKGTAAANANYLASVSPVSFVGSYAAKISSDAVTVKYNGAQVATSSVDQGSGNYGNHKLYIGRRGGSSLPFNGRLYGLVIVGASQSDAVITTLEKYMAMKTGVSI